MHVVIFRQHLHYITLPYFVNIMLILGNSLFLTFWLLALLDVNY